MKKIFILGIILILISPIVSSQTPNSTIFRNEFREWYPIGVDKEVIIQLLTEEKIEYSYISQHICINSSTNLITADSVIVFFLSAIENSAVPSVTYLIDDEGFCNGILYFDLLENLPKWSVLKSSEIIESNHFVKQEMLHYFISLHPKDGYFYVEIYFEPKLQ